MANKPSNAKQTEVSKGVAAAVTAPVVAVVVKPEWREWGAADAVGEMEGAARLVLYMDLLRDAPYPVWKAFKAEYDGGAADRGYKHPDQLRSRNVTLPLKAHGIVEPVSPTSTNARVVSAEAQAKADAAKAENEALAKMSVKEIETEIAAGKATADRTAKLWTAKAKAITAAEKATAKAAKEENAKAYNAVADQLKLMTKGELQQMLKHALAIISKRKS